VLFLNFIRAEEKNMVSHLIPLTLIKRQFY
jgi:hypothetical protein